VDLVPDPVLLRKSGSAGNRSRTSESVTRNYLTAVKFRSKHSLSSEVSAGCHAHGGPACSFDQATAETSGAHELRKLESSYLNEVQWATGY
jgi:hypothetical protein